LRALISSGFSKFLVNYPLSLIDKIGFYFFFGGLPLRFFTGVTSGALSREDLVFVLMSSF
tara:strand:- start:456 stop:635 length:180 start_codon:yes stop_codon:yes gene_type:complete